MNGINQHNSDRLRMMFQDKAIRLERGAIFDLSLAPKGPDFDFDRVEGMLLGAAIGDALGNTSESKLPLVRRRLHGEIRDYLIRDRAGYAKGYPSDDTQLTFWTLEQLLEDEGSFVPERLARKFANSGRITHRATIRSSRSVKMGAMAPKRAHSAGNGALMRIAPMLDPHLRHGGTTSGPHGPHGMMTHNDHRPPRPAWPSRPSSGNCWTCGDRPNPPGGRRYAELAGDLQGTIGYAPRGRLLRNVFHVTQ
jgi:hypothetical protein